jgi:thymidylate kinase
MDGAGKSTQIENLRAALQSMGFRVRVFTFWDDVVVFSKAREQVTVKAFKSEKGVGTPERPVERRDKNVRAWYLSVMRAGLYFCDALHLRGIVSRETLTSTDVIILDRYLYDELVNLPLRNRIIRLYIRVLARLIPTPDIAYVLDAVPMAARQRKPEYPLDFLLECRNDYAQIASMLGLTLVPALQVSSVSELVIRRATEAVLGLVTDTPNARKARSLRSAA